jgi:hypothetical protein
MPMMCWHEHDFENDPGYRATGIPPDEITCPVCDGEGGLMFAPGDWGCKTALVHCARGAGGQSGLGHGRETGT